MKIKWSSDTKTQNIVRGTCFSCWNYDRRVRVPVGNAKYSLVKATTQSEDLEINEFISDNSDRRKLLSETKPLYNKRVRIYNFSF